VNVAQMMVATDKLSVLRINWEGAEERDYSLDLRRIPFSINQQVHYGMIARFHNSIIESNQFMALINYSHSRPHFGTRCLYCIYGLLSTARWFLHCPERRQGRLPNIKQFKI